MKILYPDSPWIGDAEVAGDELVIATTREELGVLAGAINEAIEGNFATTRTTPRRTA